MNKITKNIIIASFFVSFGAFFSICFNAYLLILGSDPCPDQIRLNLGYDLCIEQNKISNMSSIVESSIYIVLCFIIPSIFLFKTILLLHLKEKVKNKQWIRILFIILAYLILITILLMIHIIITIDYSLSYWK